MQLSIIDHTAMESSMKTKKFAAFFLAILIFALLSNTACAEGLNSENKKVCVGDTFTVRYSVPEQAENVGAITLYISYDNSVLQALDMTTAAKPLSKTGRAVSAAASYNDDSGIIVASWTEPDCSIELKPETELLSVTFQALAAEEETLITGDISIKGMKTADSIGNDDLSNAESSVLMISVTEKSSVQPRLEDNGQDWPVAAADGKTQMPEESGSLSVLYIFLLTLALAAVITVAIKFHISRRKK